MSKYDNTQVYKIVKVFNDYNQAVRDIREKKRDDDVRVDPPKQTSSIYTSRKAIEQEDVLSNDITIERTDDKSYDKSDDKTYDKTNDKTNDRYT